MATGHRYKGSMNLDIPSTIEVAPAAEPLLNIDDTILELLPSAVYVCDAQGVIVRYNRKAAALWGAAPLPGDPNRRFGGAFRLYWPDGHAMPQSESPMAHVLRTGNAVRDQEIVIEQPSGDQAWVLANIDPVRNDQGRLVGAINCFQDITERKQAERRQHDDQAMLRTVFETTPECVKIVARDGTLLQMNQAGLRMIGLSSFEPIRGISVLDLIAPEDRNAWQKQHERVCQGEHLSWSFDIVAPDATRRHMETHAAPLRLPDGSTAQLAITRDMTQRRLDERRLKDSEHQLRALLDALPAAIYTTDAAGRITFYNQAAVELAGQRPTIGEDEWCVTWRLFHPDGQPMRHDECPMATALKEGREVRDLEAIAERPDGTKVPFIPYPTPLRDASGAIVGAVNMLVDISARKAAEQRQQALINELNHRVKNTLATVQSIAAQTFRGEADTPARAWFERRLIALAKAHDLLTRENWQGANLHEIALQTAAPLGDPEHQRFVISGPDLRLPPGMTLALAMALHELCTNAAKYGALCNPTGQVTIAWSVDHQTTQPRLILHWSETGGPPVEKPRHKGFGSRLIERGLPRDLGGTVRLDFAPAGVVCEINAPLP
jgi:PAS domain S-box-containing protein